MKIYNNFPLIGVNAATKSGTPGTTRLHSKLTHPFTTKPIKHREVTRDGLEDAFRHFLHRR